MRVLPRRFALVRHVDESGVSGTGAVAYGVEFADGVTVLRWGWRSGTPSTGIYASVAAVEAIHGHGGKTIVWWIESPTESILDEEVAFERRRQGEQWGDQSHLPDGTGHSFDRPAAAAMYRHQCAKAHAEGRVTWRHILLEEVYEAFAESDPLRLRAGLVQVAAVAAAWCEAIDARAAAARGADEPRPGGER